MAFSFRFFRPFFRLDLSRLRLGSSAKRKAGRRWRSGIDALLNLEQLETRDLPSTICWSNPSGGNWDVGSNWMGGQVPGPGDIAVINLTSPVTVNIQAGDSIQVQGLTTCSNDTLSISGGSLTVTDGTSSLGGALTMTGGSLIASGGSASLTANGTTTISSANLYALGGATLSLPGLNSYSPDNNTIQADGGSTLDLSNLTTVTQQKNWTIEATNGSNLYLPGLSTLGNSSQGTVTLVDTGYSYLDNNLNTLDGVNATVDGTDWSGAIGSWNTFTNGSLTVTGGSYSPSSLSDIDGSSLYVSGGGNLTLPDLADFSGNHSVLEADGTGSVLDLPALSTTSGTWSVQTSNGGEVDLPPGVVPPPVFTADTPPVAIVDSAFSYQFQASGSAPITYSAVDLPGWAQLNPSSGVLSGTPLFPGRFSISLTASNGPASAVTTNVTLIAGQTDNWTGAGDGTNWDNAANWSTGTVPGSNNIAVINTASAATITIHGGDTESIPTLTTASDDTLSITGGSLTVTDGASMLNGPLVMTGGTLTARGTGAMLTANGTTTISAANLYALGGGTLTLPGLNSYGYNSNIIQADGAGSVLDLSALNTVAPQDYFDNTLSLEATDGGTVNLNALTYLQNGTQCLINLTDTGHSSLDDGNLTALDEVNATLDGTDTQVAGSWNSLTNGSLSAQGGSYALPNLTDVDGSSLHVGGGGTLTLTGVMNFAGDDNVLEADGAGSVLDLSQLSTASGSWNVQASNGGEVELPSGLPIPPAFTADTPPVASVGFPYTYQFQASGTTPITFSASSLPSWAHLNSSGLLSGTPTTAGPYSFGVMASNGLTSNATVNVTLVAGQPDNWRGPGGGNWDNAAAWSTGTVPGSGNIAVINTASAATITIDSSDTESILSLTTAANDTLSITGGSVTVTDGSSSLGGPLVMTGGTLTATGAGALLTANGATTITGANLYALAGATLSLPGLNSYAPDDNTFQADGAGSVLGLSGLTTLTYPNGAAYWKIEATNGGELNVSGLATLGNGDGGIYVTDTGHGTLLDGNVATVNGVLATLDGTDPNVAASWTSFTNGSLTVTGGSYNLPGITDADGSSFWVFTGGSLAVTGLTTYLGPYNGGTYFWADGPGSTLDLSGLTTLKFQYSDIDESNWYDLEATSGGTLNLSGLSSVGNGDPDNVAITDKNNSTLLDDNLATLNGVTVTLDGTDPQVANSWLSVANSTLTVYGGLATIPNLAGFSNSNLQLNEGAVLFTNGNTLTLEYGSQITIAGTVVSLPATGTNGSTFNIPSAPGLIIDLQFNGTMTNTTFNVGEGTTVVLAGGTYLGTTTFNVAQGANVNLTGGPGLTSYGGTLTGTGSGSVTFGGFAPLAVAIGGLTLDFPGNLFQWTGSVFAANLGDVTNLGTMNLTGPDDKGFYDDATLYNYGSIIQTGSGDLDMRSNNVAPTTLVNEAGAYYLIESDSGITNNNGQGVDNALQNAGIIRKTAGTGTSQLYIDGPLSNTGTIEADSGTLYLDANSITQISGSSLTAGTWNAESGSTLEFPSGTAITSNSANIALAGSGSNIIGIAGLVTNSGSFSVSGGAQFTAAGSFTNSGSLTLGPAGSLKVSGGFAQTSGGSLDEQIGGSPASGLFGQATITGTATLAGALNLAFVNGSVPQAGAAFPVMSYGQAIGNFTTFTGLSPYFTESQGANALDLVNGSGNPVDLAAVSVTAPTAAIVGQQIEINWQASNLSGNPASGSWEDSVFLSTTPAITASSTLLGSVSYSSGLGVGDSYSASLTAALPAVAPGSYYILVDVDSLYQQSDLNRANNTMTATTGQIDVTVPSLTLGSPASESFTAAGQNQYYQISVPAGGALIVSLQSAAQSGATALYVSQGTEPTPYSYQEAANIANQPNQTAVVPHVSAPGTYFILAQGVSGSPASSDYTLRVSQVAALTVTGISPYAGGNAGNVTVEIDGTNFTASTTASMTLAGSTVTASAIDLVSASQMFATFNLTGATPGNYTLSVKQGAQTVAAPTTFQVVAASQGSLNVQLGVPQYVRSGRTGTIVISYANDTENDMVAPLLDIQSTNTSIYFSTPDDTNDYTQDAEVLAVAPSGPAGILRPGQSGTFTLTILSHDNIDGDSIPVQLSQIEAGETIDWSPEESLLQPSNIPSAAWNTIWTNLMAMVGTTTDSYNSALAQAATYLSSLGESRATVSDVGRLWAFRIGEASASFPTTTLTSAVDASLSTPGSLSLAIDRTFQSSIDGRSRSGLFGLGWTTSWQTSLSVDSLGNVTINFGGNASVFSAQANGTYLDTDGGYGALTNSGGIFTFTDTNGTRYVFLPSGQLDYEQDTKGNRITLSYNGQDQLVTLTYANPSDPSEPSEQLSLAYSIQGFVSQVTDGTGDVWVYTYDAAGHLLSVVAPGPTGAGLTTSYTYDTGSNPETANALLSITDTDGSQQNFTYDALGRLSSTSANGGTEATTYSYLAEAEVMATDAAGDQTIVWYNELGLAARVQDPLDGISSYLYDNNGNLVNYSDAAGATYQYAYDQNGNLTTIVNPLGQSVEMTYNSLSNLTSFTDAGNNTTQYSYSSAGNLLNITYPDGTQQSFSYDPLGDLSETILQNNDPIRYQTNAQGLVTQENFADGTYDIFGYDAHGNLLTAQTYNSTGQLTGTTTLQYNAAKELTFVSYPGGLSLTFTYNALGQRTQSVDQTGYTINYSYDALGRLSELTDGSSNPIVQYTYNNLGQLVNKLNGNGTYTTYAYDAAGNLTREVNYAGGTTVNSSFSYTYNVLKEMTSMTDANGIVTTYGYDALGQLTQVGLPGGATIAYVYNAAGDRTEVINDGTATSYASNSDNEITQAGSTHYSYDANGNLATVTDASGTATYIYNDLNQLVSITNPDGSGQSFQYSPLGFMVGTSASSASTTSQTNYLVDPTGLGNVVAAYNGSGSLIADYVLGLGLVSQTGPAGSGYYDFDGSSNTVGITGLGGSYVNQYSYLPFGATTTISAALPNPFTFVGQAGVMQIGNNLFSMRAREYLPATGQFLSNDPLGLAGGDSNVRRYVGNDPTTEIDPAGLDGSGVSGTGLLGQSQAGLAGLYGIPTLAPGYQNSNQTNTAGTSGNSNQTDIGGISPQEHEKHEAEGDAFARQEAIWELQRKIDYQQSREGAWVPNRKKNIETYKTYIENHRNLIKKDEDIIKGLNDTDPNSLSGPAGFGVQDYIQGAGNLPYTIDFENDGSVAAQDVSIAQQLDSNVDWSTFQLGSFGFGQVNVSIPAGLTDYQATVRYENTDGTSLNVLVDLNFNVQTGLLQVSFTSLDPVSGQAPTGVFDGFLYPESQSAINSDGFVQYTVQPKAGLASGTTITGERASVVFDTNPPVLTNTVTNTIDATAPTSSVAMLPATENSSNFTVNWSGSDPNGPGIASYNVFVSDNGGPYTPLVGNAPSTETSATFTGQNGHTYAFYSIATDNLGLVQATPTAAQAQTVVNTGTPTSTVIQAAGGNPNPSIYGQSLTFTATVSNTSGTGGTPTGLVTFYNGTTALGIRSLSKGTATLTLTTLPAGASAISATYNGSATSAVSSSPTSVSQTVGSASTSTSAVSAASTNSNPSIYGQSLTFAATVTNTSAMGAAPTGLVAFYNGSTDLGARSLVAGTATITLTTLPVGTDSITAMYLGTANCASSSSPPGSALAQTVHKATTTSIEMAAPTNPANPTYGQSLSFTAIVSCSSGVPTGAVTFYNGTSPLGTRSLVSGTATLTLTTLPGGTDSISATYLGEGNFASSSSTLALTQTVALASTSTSVTASPSPATHGQTVRLMATVSNTAGTGAVPTGTVTFKDVVNGVTTALGTRSLVDGVATFTTSSLAAGSYDIEAIFNLTMDFLASSGNVLEVVT